MPVHSLSTSDWDKQIKPWEFAPGRGKNSPLTIYTPTSVRESSKYSNYNKVNCCVALRFFFLKHLARMLVAQTNKLDPMLQMH